MLEVTDLMFESASSTFWTANWCATICS